MFQGTSCTANRNTHFMFRQNFFPKSRRLRDNEEKNMAETDRPQITT